VHGHSEIVTNSDYSASNELSWDEASEILSERQLAWVSGACRNSARHSPLAIKNLPGPQFSAPDTKLRPSSAIMLSWHLPDRTTQNSSDRKNHGLFKVSQQQPCSKLYLPYLHLHRQTKIILCHTLSSPRPSRICNRLRVDAPNSTDLPLRNQLYLPPSPSIHSRKSLPYSKKDKHVGPHTSIESPRRALPSATPHARLPPSELRNQRPFTCTPPWQRKTILINHSNQSP
jgi:hypothetical protein